MKYYLFSLTNNNTLSFKSANNRQADKQIHKQRNFLNWIILGSGQIWVRGLFEFFQND